MEKIQYKMTWCEYITPCKYRKNIMVGEYDCYQCPFFKKDVNHEVQCSCKEDTRIKHVTIKSALVVRRIIWFFNGRLARRLYIRRDIRKYWQIFWWGLIGILAFTYILIPIFECWDGVVAVINRLRWGI